MPRQVGSGHHTRSLRRRDLESALALSKQRKRFLVFKLTLPQTELGRPRPVFVSPTFHPVTPPRGRADVAAVRVVGARETQALAFTPSGARAPVKAPLSLTSYLAPMPRQVGSGHHTRSLRRRDLESALALSKQRKRFLVFKLTLPQTELGRPRPVFVSPTIHPVTPPKCRD